MRATDRHSLLSSFLLCALCVLCGESLFAHPVPKENHDRAIAVELTPAAVVVKYQLDVDATRAELDLVALELPPEDLAPITSEKAFHKTFLRQFGTILANNLDARLDGEPLAFRHTTGERDASVQDHLRYAFTFTAHWSPHNDRPHTFTFRESNYEDKKDNKDKNVIQLTLSHAPGVILQSSTAPDKDLLERASLERRPGDTERLRTASATFILTETSPSEGADQPTTDLQTKVPDAPEDEHPQKLLHLLLDTRRGLIMLLIMAAGFGAVHALTPGHGKTLVAAYLVGEHGTVWHALLLGLMTTLTHTGAVFVLAIVFLISPGAANYLYFVQGLVGGLFITGLGMWLLTRRLSGRADHFHLGGHSHHHHHHHHDHLHSHDHDHDHSHDHSHEHTHIHVPPGGSVRWWHLALLGMRGGLVPCWDAIILLALAISAQRLWLGVPLLLAFSAGLAGVLVGLGVGVVWTRNWVAARWGEGQRMRRMIAMLPLVSAAFITVLGLWLCYESLHPEAPPITHSSRH